MENIKFLNCIKQAFIRFLETGSRSNQKLVILHGFIAKDLAERLGDGYHIKSLGIGNGKEGSITGRYMDKNVDIAIYKDNRPIAGFGVKFVMQNYAQNSNNYFENMLGETVNIQGSRIPYFQIFIVPDVIPYYNNEKEITKWEGFTRHHAEKYIKLSKDNADHFFHSPAKTLLYVVHLSQENVEIQDQAQYKAYYLNTPFTLTESNLLAKTDFGKGVIVNDYATFIEKAVHRIKFE